MRKVLSDWILDLAKYPNWKTCFFTFMCFPVGALPEVKKLNLKVFSHKVRYKYY